MPLAIAFSPHLDDAVFSCGGTLARLVQHGWTVTICTAFTRSVAQPSGFALDCQRDKGLADDVDYMAQRRAEDTAACGVLGAQPVWLDLLEAPHRSYPDAASLFGTPRSHDRIADALSPLLMQMLDPLPDLVLAPQALGGHVDHVQLLKALRPLLPKTADMLFWNDFPYATRPHTHPAQPFAEEMNRLPEQHIEGDAPARLKASLAYGTQVGFQFGGPDGLTQLLAAAGSAERFRGADMAVPNCLRTSGFAGR